MNAWLYILVAEGPEDLLKVGLTRDPLSRWSAFHPRWYEVFNLSRSMLVACETRSDAQQLETALHRQLVAHRCPTPLTIRLQAAGATEWYRGAYPAALHFVADCEAGGHSVKRDPATYLLPAMQNDSHRLDSLLRQAHSELLAGWLSTARRRALLDWVDGHLHFEPDLEAALPYEAWEAVRRGAP